MRGWVGEVEWGGLGRWGGGVVVPTPEVRGLLLME